jgi:CRP-like cAMP-binding protein
MEDLLNLLNTIRPLSNKLRNTLIEMLKRKEVAEGEYILKEGEVCNKICFIEKGLFGSFYLAEKNEVASWFMKQGDVFVSVSSYFDQAVSRESIMALEDSVVWYVTYDEYIYLKNTFPEFDSIRGELLEYYYKLADYRQFITIAQSAKRRCEFYFEYLKELAEIVPDMYAAAYLGMNASTFSRSKKKFFRSRQKSGRG